MPSNPIKSDAPKYQIVRDQIAAAIRAGEWERGAQLPSELELAQRYGVSYMTARRAVGELLENDLVERRGQNRTFVREAGETKLASTTVNLIWTPSGNETLLALLQLCQKEARARGLEPRLICWSNGSKRAALRAIADGFPTLIGLGFVDLQGPLLAAITKAASTCVIVGNRLDECGVASVLADDAQGVRMAVARLRELGHRKIGLISNREADPIDAVRRQTWRECCADATSEQLDNRLIYAPPSNGKSTAQATYDALRARLNSSHADLTALLCPSDQVAISALAACGDSGWNVPEKMSLLTFSSRPILAFVRPSLATVDADLERHVQLAFELLTKREHQPLLQLVEPRLVNGQSLAAITE